MKTLSSVLKALMTESCINESELARQTGVAQPVVHRICSGGTDNPKVKTLKPIANYFDVSISQLIGDEPFPQHRTSGNHRPGAKAWQHVPVLRWQEVLRWPDAAENIQILETILVDLELSENSYAVYAQDETMAPRFPDGSILIIDPALKPMNHDYIILHIENQPLPSFKQILIEEDDMYLRPVNPDLKTVLLNKPHRFLGVMVQSRMDFRKTRRQT